MRIQIVICDICHNQILGAVMMLAQVPGDLCSDCVRLAKTDTECQHEDNISDAVPGRTTARLICKDCGYDRTEEVA